MLQQPCTPRPRPPTFSRSRTTNRRTTAERRVASQVDERSSTASNLLDDPPGPSQQGPPQPPTQQQLRPPTKPRTVSAPVQGGLETIDDQLVASGRTSLSSSSESTVASPPPPYRTFLPTIHGLEELRTAEQERHSRDVLGIDLGKIESEMPLSAPVSEEWVKERSREELDLLLLEADRVIREREKELGIAAAIGKSLLENNIALRKRHESILQAVPESSPSSPTEKTESTSDLQRPPWNASDDPGLGPRTHPASDPPTATILFPTHDRQQSSGSVSDSQDVFQTSSTVASAVNSPVRAKRVSLLAVNSPVGSAIGSYSKGHSKRAASLTASPQALALLRDQNHELATQLEQLQAETSQADHSGRKSLRKLEKEIGGLRAELEKMETMVESLQEKNGELEVQFVRAISPSVGRTPRDGGWAERRKVRREEEWEMKVEDLEGPRKERFVFPKQSREPSSSSDTLSSAGSDLFHQSSSGHLERSTSSTSSSSPPASPRSRSISLLGPTLSQSRSGISRHSASPSIQRSNAEMEVVAQLLAKIRELEETNTEIRRKRDELDLKLSRAIREGAALEDVYDALEDEVERAGLELRSDFGGEEEDEECFFPERDMHSTSLPHKGFESASDETDIFSGRPDEENHHRNNSFSQSSFAASILQRSHSHKKETNFGHPSPTKSTSYGSPTPSPFSSMTRATGNRLMIAARREVEKELGSPDKSASSFVHRHRRSQSSISYKFSSPARSVDYPSRAATPETSGTPAGRSLGDELKAFETSPTSPLVLGRHGRTPKRSSLYFSISNDSPETDGNRTSLYSLPRESTLDEEKEKDKEAASPEMPPRRASGRHVALRSGRRSNSQGTDTLARRRTPVNLHVMPPIVSPGSLATASPADCPSFDALDSAVAERPMRWAEDSLFGSASLVLHAPVVPRSIWSFFPSLLPRQDGDPFESNIYRELSPLHDEQTAIARLHFREARIRLAVEAGEDPWTEENLRPPTRRELALLRLDMSASAAGHSSDGSSSDDDFQLVDAERRGRKVLSAPTDGPMDRVERMKPGWVIDRVGKSWMRSAMEVVFCVQVLVVGLLFLGEVFRTRKKRVRAIKQGSAQN